MAGGDPEIAVGKLAAAVGEVPVVRVAVEQREADRPASPGREQAAEQHTVVTAEDDGERPRVEYRPDSVGLLAREPRDRRHVASAEDRVAQVDEVGRAHDAGEGRAEPLCEAEAEQRLAEPLHAARTKPEVRLDMEHREWEHLRVDNMHGAYRTSSAEEGTGGTLDLVGAAALAISEAVWAAVGLERSDAAALNLVLAEERISIGALARELGLSHSAAVRVVDRLERDRLLRRTTPGPGRTVALVVTARGRRRAEQSIDTRARILERATADFSPGERETLLRLLARSVWNLTHDQYEIDRACRLCDQRGCLGRGCPLPVRR